MSSNSDTFRLSPTRRKILGMLGAGAGLTALGSAAGAARSSDDWTIVAIPDTQIYAKRQSRYAPAQTEWIADNRDSENIAFVSHEGDVVEYADDEAEWEYMDDAFSNLDGVVPYSVVPGNHDWESWMDRSSSIANYKEYVGPSRFEGREWFGGAGPTNGDENRDELNTYQLFSAGGYDFLHLGLEWEAPGSTDDPSTPLGWAQKVLDEHPDRPTILTTHAYLRDSPPRRPSTLEETNDDGNSPETIWEELVAPNPQVFMVLCGHWRNDGEARHVSTNDDGLPVYEILTNYQHRTNGGLGFLRRIEFRPGEGGPDRIQVRTYSPARDEFETDDDSEFAFDLDFDERFGVESSAPPDGESATFRQGSNGYDGTVDTTLREADPETSYGTDPTATADADDPQGSGDRTQFLLRFDGVVGTAEGQVPPGATVEEATLTLETADAGDGAAVHRVLSAWSEDDTWASTDGGVRADGTDAASDPVTETGSVGTGPTDVDVTDSVQAWVDGARNHGWVFRPSGDDGWDVRTAESDAPPTLTVRYASPETIDGDADGDGDVDADDAELVQRSIAGEDVDIDEDAADVDDDGELDIADAVGIENLSEDGA